MNRVLCPFKSSGREVVDFVTRPKVADFLALASMSSSGIAPAEIRIGPESALVGRELRELGTREADRLSFVALEATGAEIRIPPRGTAALGANDLLIDAGDPDQVAKLSELARARGVHAA